MKIITTLLTGCLLNFAASAQSISTGVSFNKSTQPAVLLLLPYSEGIAEGTILQNLKENGYDPETKGKAFWKQNKVNGFYTFKGVVLKDMDKQPLDLYSKVEAKGKKENETAKIYLLASKGNEQFISPETDLETHNATKKFLNKFLEQSAAFKLLKDIEMQQEEVTDAQKKYFKMQETEKELLKKIAQLQEELRLNKLQQENQEKVIETEKTKLGELKTKTTGK